jgi:DNA ligase-1
MFGSNHIMKIIDGIAATASKNDKQAMVKAGCVDEQFKRVCQYAYDPFKTFGIVKYPGTMGEYVGNEFDAGTWELLDGLISRKLTGSAAIEAVRGELTTLSSESADLFFRIIRKDLRAGFSESTCNKAVKGLIPSFPYMRCSLPKDADLVDWPWVEGVISQEKADGMFANCDHEVDGRVAMRSRQGSEFPMDKFAGIESDVSKRTIPGHQLHGEIVVLRDGVVCKREDGNGVMNSVLSGGDFAPNEKPMYLIWDQIPLASVIPKGKHNIGYKKRLIQIMQQLKNVAGDSVELIPTRIVKSLAEAKLHAAELMKKGKEGTIVKHPGAVWKDGTSKEQIKIKLEFEVDLKIIAIVPGKDGGKNEGRAGSLTCATSDNLLEVDVTVKNEAMRDLVDALPEDWVGRIIAVVANDIMEPGESSSAYSLYLPRMAEANYRRDKTGADSLSRVLAQKQAAIYGEALLEEAAA